MRFELKKYFFMLFAVLLSFTAFAQGVEPFAVLKSGPERQWGFPGFANDSGLCLSGVYTLRDKSSATVRAVPAGLAYDAQWKNAGMIAKPLMQYNGGNLFALRITLRNRNETMRGALDWTVLFEFELHAEPASISAFVSYFSERFEYFGSIAPSIADISFPAVLGEEKK